MSQSNSRSTTTSGGIGIGAVIAIVLSWTVNHSVLWCFLHALCGWFYVIYWLFVHGPWK